jgi:hypothetical protein
MGTEESRAGLGTLGRPRTAVGSTHVGMVRMQVQESQFSQLCIAILLLFDSYVKKSSLRLLNKDNPIEQALMSREGMAGTSSAQSKALAEPLLGLAAGVF